MLYNDILKFYKTFYFQRILNLSILFLFAILACGECYKILGIFPFPILSHYLWVQHFLQELLNRGHELTIITNFKFKEPHPNLTEILIDPMFDVPKNCKSFLFNIVFIC